MLGIGIVLVVALLFARTLASNWENIQDIELSLFPHAIFATLLFAVAVAVSGWLWGLTLRTLTGNVVTDKEAARVHIGAWLLKYVPGQAGSIVYKLAWAKANNVSRAQVALSFIYENLLLTFASTIPTLPIILLSVGDRSGSNLLILLIGIMFLPVIFSSTLLGSIIEKAAKKYTKTAGSIKLLSFRQLVGLTTLYVIPRIINAAGFIVVASSMLQVTPSMYLPLGAIYVLAGIVGIYAIFVPSGLGVREAVVVLFASAYFSPEEAIVLALLARFYATLADGLLSLVYAYMSRRKAKAV